MGGPTAPEGTARVQCGRVSYNQVKAAVQLARPGPYMALRLLLIVSAAPYQDIGAALLPALCGPNENLIKQMFELLPAPGSRRDHIDD